MLATPRRPPVRFGVFEADLDAGELRKQGMRLKLPQQAFRVLQVLIERPNEVISREELQQSLWASDTFVEFDHGLNNAVNRLRDVLGDHAQSPSFIETVPRRGYRFIAPIINDSQPASSPPLVLPLPTVEPQQETRRFTPRRSAVFAGILLIVAALLFVILPPAWRSRSRGTGDATVQALAVLPFLNLSGDPGQDYFADGMTEALIVELSSLGGFRVISRTSSMQYKDVTKPAADIANELGVDAVVEGSVLRDGNRMRVTVQLIGARSDTNLWTQSFEREVDTDSRVSR